MHILREVVTGGLQKETAAHSTQPGHLIARSGALEQGAGAGKVGNCSKKKSKEQPASVLAPLEQEENMRPQHILFMIYTSMNKIRTRPLCFVMTANATENLTSPPKGICLPYPIVVLAQ